MMFARRALHCFRVTVANQNQPAAMPMRCTRPVGASGQATRRSVSLTALGIGLLLPALTGALDLYWRSHTI
jgi:hypothetical protein